MLMQPLLDQLIQLHLPAFRDGLQEQLHNPQYAELSFEERLALLVEREVTLRQDHRLQRRIKLAAFPQSATVEDLDLSPHTDWSAASCWNWLSPAGSTSISIPSFLDRPDRESPSSVVPLELRLVVPIIPCVTSRTSRLLFQLRTSSCGRFVFPHCWKVWQRSICSFWMIGCATRSRLLRHTNLLEILDDRFGRSSTLRGFPIAGLGMVHAIPKSHSC